MSRRRLLTAGAAAGAAGLVAGAAGGAGAVLAADGNTEAAPAPTYSGTATVPFFGARQAGIAQDPPAHGSFVAFSLRDGVDRKGLGRMLRLLSDDAARLTQGIPALGDSDAELARFPSRLTVTFGFGPGLYRRAGLTSPVADLPAFPKIDRLERRWSGGDLLLQICSDDPVAVAHAQRMTIKDALPFATVRWVQQGFRNSPGVQAPEHTQRNLLGQLDGTANPKGPDMEAALWNADGSTTLVVRRIRTEIVKWDLLGVADKENATGRYMATGAPLSGQGEHDEPDFAALNDAGLPKMPDFSHVTRAHVSDAKLKILRRPYNYDGMPDANGNPDSGLIFAAYQRSIVEQFLPIQQRLAERDLLNEWITPIGSAVFAIAPGCAEGGWIGEGILG